MLVFWVRVVPEQEKINWFRWSLPSSEGDGDEFI